jgi:hypothetical protein
MERLVSRASPLTGPSEVRGTMESWLQFHVLSGCQVQSEMLRGQGDVCNVGQEVGSGHGGEKCEEEMVHTVMCSGESVN